MVSFLQKVKQKSFFFLIIWVELQTIYFESWFYYSINVRKKEKKDFQNAVSFQLHIKFICILQERPGEKKHYIYIKMQHLSTRMILLNSTAKIDSSKWAIAKFVYIFYIYFLQISGNTLVDCIPNQWAIFNDEITTIVIFFLKFLSLQESHFYSILGCSFAAL